MTHLIDALNAFFIIPVFVFQLVLSHCSPGPAPFLGKDLIFALLIFPTTLGDNM